MFDVKKEYKSIMTRLGLTLLFFLLVSNLLVGGVELVSLFGNLFVAESDVMYITTELVSAFAYLLSFILPVPFFYIISKGAPKHQLNLALSLPSPFSGFKLWAIVMAGLAIIIPASYLNSLIYTVSNDAVNEFLDFDFSSPYKLVLSFISTALFPAFAEELLFRGLIVSNIKPYSKSAAVVISAVAFGLMHQNPMQLLFATAAGVALGMIYVETDSIWCCIVLHFINNFIFSQDTYYFSEDGSSRLHTFEVEQVAVMSSSDSSVRVLSSDDTFFRCVYDDDMRLLSKVTWKINKSDKTSSVVLEEEFFYKDDSLSVSKSNAKDLENNVLTKKFFTDSGLLSKEEKYDLTQENKEIIFSKTIFTYNKDSELTEKEITTFDNINEKINEKFTERFVLQNPGNERSGYDYYKNNVLLRSVKYTSENSYTQKIFFDTDKSVFSVYENGLLVDQVISINGKEFRRKIN